MIENKGISKTQHSAHAHGHARTSRTHTHTHAHTHTRKHKHKHTHKHNCAHAHAHNQIATPMSTRDSKHPLRRPSGGCSFGDDTDKHLLQRALSHIAVVKGHTRRCHCNATVLQLPTCERLHSVIPACCAPSRITSNTVDVWMCSLGTSYVVIAPNVRTGTTAPAADASASTVSMMNALARSVAPVAMFTFNRNVRVNLLRRCSGVPMHWSCPWAMMPMRLQRACASSMLCDTNPRR